MQETRQMILEILRELGEATVEDIVRGLNSRRGDITPVTVRHHLNLLQQDELITIKQLRHRNTPGRPQHLYMLTDKARGFFPNNYEKLAAHLIAQIEAHLPPDGVNVIIQGVADTMASEACIPEGPMEERLRAVTHFLSENGYEADWEVAPGGFLLQTSNCPYHQLAQESGLLCTMDMRLIAKMLGVVPRLVSRVADGDSHCSYFVPPDAVS